MTSELRQKRRGPQQSRNVFRLVEVFVVGVQDRLHTCKKMDKWLISWQLRVRCEWVAKKNVVLYRPRPMMEKILRSQKEKHVTPDAQMSGVMKLGFVASRKPST